MSKALGTLYGLSVGTGDPELITVKAVRLLQQVPVVAFPAGIGDKPGMAQQIVAPWLQTDQEKLPLIFPYVQDEQVLQQAWQVAAQRVWPYLQRGQDVAFACEGDVSFYSTFTYLAQASRQLSPEIKIETVPGVCSPMAAASVLGLPLTTSNQRLAILPALYHVEALEQALSWADVLVLLKVSSVYSQVWPILQRHHLLERACIVERATFGDQMIYQNLSDRPHLSLSYFSLLIVPIPS